MIRSMTGFARAEAQGPWGRIAWELRSVNHRYLDVSLRLPEELRGLESEARQRISARAARGKVEATLRHAPEVAGAARLVLDASMLKQVREALDEVTQAVGATLAPDPMRILAWPGVIRADAPDSGPLAAAALQLLDRAAAEFSGMREREGAAIAAHLADRCDTIAAHVKAVRQRAPQVRDAWLERLRHRCRELGVDVDPARLEQETVIAAQRLDVDEELSRLETHLKEIRGAGQRGEAVGRRLDFLMQELNREANTLSSKSQDAELTRLAVEIKVVIEQMREQVQNVE